ncbi:hypothetical protein RQP46_006995 [Phenoliferia psychrophenolica]
MSTPLQPAPAPSPVAPTPASGSSNTTSASSLASLLELHSAALSSLYTSLSPSPSPLLHSSLSALESILTSALAAQLSSAQSLVQAAQLRLSSSLQRVSDWQLALGDTPTTIKGEGLPLERQIADVDRVLEGMRGRMDERGKQIVRLQRRLNKLVEVLGIEFLDVTLENVDDGWEQLDLRLERMSQLEREALRCDAEVTRRRTLIHAHVNEIFSLRTELGIHQDSPPSPSSSSSSLPTSDSDAPHNPEQDPFDEKILCHLAVGDRDKVELAPTTENLERVKAKHQWLEDERENRNQIVQSTYDKLYPLWAMLGVSEAESDEFVNRWVGSTSDVVRAYQAELSRMLTLKRSNLSSFILRERDALTALWDALYLAPGQRDASFPPFAISVEPTRVFNAVHGYEEELVNENVSEELLVAHEREREKVEGEVQRSMPVLERLKKYFEVVEEMRELEASAADPSRLLGKTTRGDPGRLLREEKARKRVIKDKPKLESELRQIIPQWEQEHGRPFLINGRRFIDSLDQRLEAEAAEKELKKRGKAAISASSSAPRTLPLRAQKTGGSSSTTPAATPLKRQMTGGLATSAKRQVAMPTGSSSSSSLSSSAHPPARPPSRSGGVLGEIGNHNAQAARVLRPQATGGGMKIPAGWGGPDSPTKLGGGGGVAKTDALQGSATVVQAQAAGGAAFRPRSSTLQSSTSGGGIGWSATTRGY